MLFIKLPSGRSLSYVKPKIGENRFGSESVTYEGVGSTVTRHFIVDAKSILFSQLHPY